MLLVALGVLQVSLNAAAQVGISRRPASEVHGSKIGWRLISLINVFGPLAYFRWGRVSQKAQPKKGSPFAGRSDGGRSMRSAWGR
jgi:hypothetical protein